MNDGNWMKNSGVRGLDSNPLEVLMRAIIHYVTRCTVVSPNSVFADIVQNDSNED